MKSIAYFIISVILLLSLCSSDGGTKVVYLQATGTGERTVLKQSADIISERLKLFGLKSYEVTVTSGPGQIKIEIPDNTDVSEIEGLLTSRGEIAFYETYNREEISEIFKEDDQIYKLVNRIQDQSLSFPIVGCTDESQRTTEADLKSVAKEKNCVLLWGSEKEEWGYCLFALKTSSDNRPLLIRSDIESVGFSASEDFNHKINVKLKPGASVIFAEATERNIGKCISIVIDDKVYAWPVVRDAIKGGEIEVTGSFNAKEIRYFPVIFNTDQLPLTFRVTK
jgi:preprotein translocase subunit SecD